MESNKIAELVTPEWLQAQLRETGLQVNQVAALTGVRRTNISSWMNGKAMSAASKAMFCYFFAYYKIKMREQQAKALKEHRLNGLLDSVIKEIDSL